MSENFAAILERFRLAFQQRGRGNIDLTIRPEYIELLKKLGNPQDRLPPVLHVAGTNGKGSTCAFMRAMLEAAGYKVHVYTSPYLIRFNERIRVAGALISDQELTDILTECETLLAPGSISQFELETAAAFVVFARHPADFTILEVGLGGRKDATNVVGNKLATLITRLSFDHRDFLGDTIEKIALEKAGIMRPGVPCFAAGESDPLALQVLCDAVVELKKTTGLKTPLSIGGIDWKIAELPQGFVYRDISRTYELPPPKLLGRHQYQNAGLAIAALSVLPQPLPLEAIRAGLQNVEWQARLQNLTGSSVATGLPKGSECWLDGGHNDSAGAALADQAERWRNEDGANPKPLVVILGMLATKQPAEFIAPLAEKIARLYTVGIDDKTMPSYDAPELVGKLSGLGIGDVRAAEGFLSALRAEAARQDAAPVRILICGSLYLAGNVLEFKELQEKRLHRREPLAQLTH